MSLGSFVEDLCIIIIDSCIEELTSNVPPSPFHACTHAHAHARTTCTQCTHVAEYARDTYSKTGAHLLGSIAIVHPFIISALLDRAETAVGAVGEVRGGAQGGRGIIALLDRAETAVGDGGVA